MNEKNYARMNNLGLERIEFIHMCLGVMDAFLSNRLSPCPKNILDEVRLKGFECKLNCDEDPNCWISALENYSLTVFERNYADNTLRG